MLCLLELNLEQHATPVNNLLFLAGLELSRKRQGVCYTIFSTKKRPCSYFHLQLEHGFFTAKLFTPF